MPPVPHPVTPAAASAPVAQLDRAPDYESGGQEFESLRARHFPSRPARRLGTARHLAIGRLAEENGAPEEIRTPDPQIRSLVLYPAELRVRTAANGEAAI